MNKQIYNWLAVLLLIVSAYFVKGDNPMPRGFPDGDVSNYNYASRASDVAVVYQMLWGFSPIDSQGRMFYLDTFNNGLSGWGTEAFGAGAAVPVLISTTNPDLRSIYSPPSMVKFIPGVTANDISGLFRELYFGTNRRIGLEAEVVIGNLAPDYFFRIVYRVSSDKKYNMVIKFSHSAASWQIDTPSGFQNIFPISIASIGFIHQQIKVVGDWETGKYVRALIGDNLIDLSAYSMPTNAVAVDGTFTVVCRAISYGAASKDGYLGYVLLTKDEP